MLTRTLQNLLQCPICSMNESLVFKAYTESVFTCKNCLCAFTLYNGIFDFLSADVSYLTNQTWSNKLNLQRKWWIEERLKLKRESVVNNWVPSPTFINKYLSLNSIDTGRYRIILDIGCGEGDRHKNFFKMNYVGLDPLLLKEYYPFPFIRGIAERIPFVDKSVDVITSVESIDHFLDPTCSIKEILRCLAPGGALFIFVGDGLVRDKAYSSRQRLFSTTEDDVHTYSFSTNYFRELLNDIFVTLEIDQENNYIAVWGWNKKS